MSGFGENTDRGGDSQNRLGSTQGPGWTVEDHRQRASLFTQRGGRSETAGGSQFSGEQPQHPVANWLQDMASNTSNVETSSQGTGTTRDLKRNIERMEIGDNPPIKKIKMEDFHKIRTELATIEKSLQEAIGDINSLDPFQQKEEYINQCKEQYKKWERSAYALEYALRVQHAQRKSDLQELKAVESLRSDHEQTLEDICKEQISPSIRGSDGVTPLQERIKEISEEIAKKEAKLPKNKNGEIFQDNELQSHITGLEKVLANRENKRTTIYRAYQNMPRQHTQLEVSSSSRVDTGKAPDATEQDKRARYTEKELQDHIINIARELHANTKPPDLSTLKLWRKTGEEITPDETNDIKSLTIKLRESGILNNYTTKEINITKLCNRIRSYADESNPEIRAKRAALQAFRRADPKKRAEKAAYQAFRREDPEIRAKEAAYQAAYKKNKAEKAGEQTSSLGTQDQPGPSSQGFTRQEE